MKTNSKILLVATLLLIALTSCKKQVEDKYANLQNTDIAKTTSEIKANENFNWNTENKLSLNYKGLPNDVRIAVLKVTDLSGNIIFNKIQKANENFSTTIVVSAQTENVIVDFGGLAETVSTKGNILNMQLN